MSLTERLKAINALLDIGRRNAVQVSMEREELYSGHMATIDEAIAALSAPSAIQERDITSAMEEAGMAEVKRQYNLSSTRAGVAAIYKAMLAAAPVTPVPEGLPHWQPIETAPKDGTWFLAFRPDVPHIDQIHWRTGVFGEMEWGGNSWSYPKENQPTHWMPLPKPPMVLTMNGGSK